MWPVRVVFASAVLGHDLGFEQGVELFGREEFVAEFAVERFHVGVLPR